MYMYIYINTYIYLYYLLIQLRHNRYRDTLWNHRHAVPNAKQKRWPHLHEYKYANISLYTTIRRKQQLKTRKNQRYKSKTRPSISKHKRWAKSKRSVTHFIASVLVSKPPTPPFSCNMMSWNLHRQPRKRRQMLIELPLQVLQRQRLLPATPWMTRNLHSSSSSSSSSSMCLRRCNATSSSRCDTLQHTATHCNILQHTATQTPRAGTLCACYLRLSSWKTPEFYSFNIYV